MKKLILIAALAFASFGTSFAQVNARETSFGSFSTTSSLTSEAVITVLGAYAGSGKAGSDASVIQSGDGNSVNLKLAGSGNVLTAKQTGNHNSMSMDFIGSDSKYVLDQDGSSNSMNLNNVTSTGINFQVIQKSNNNGLTIDGASTGSLPSLKIEQTGGMQINITTNAFFLKP